MKLRAWFGALALGAALAPAGSSPAQDAGGPPPPRDPFDPTEALRRAGGEFVAGESPEGAPPMRIRGFAEDEGGVVVALLEVTGFGTFLVRAGDSFTLQSGRSTVALKVVEATHRSLVVEVGRFQASIVVR